MLFLEYVDYQKTNILLNLCEIWQKIYNETDDNVISSEIREYLLSFVQREALKERIKFDNFSYFLIREKQQDNNEKIKPRAVGFIEYFKRKDYYSIEEFSVLNEFKTSVAYEFLIKELSKKLDSNFKLYVNKKSHKDIELFRGLNFEIVKEELKYLGSNYFLAENVMELKKIL